MKAINLFEKSEDRDEVLYIIYFQACAKIGSIEGLNLIKTVLNDIRQSFYENKRLLTCLIDALMECGDVEKGELIYNCCSNPSIQMKGALMKGMFHW